MAAEPESFSPPREIVKYCEDYRWDGVDVLVYKEGEGTHFKDITRQVLFPGLPELHSQLRYFEMKEGGHSTLEKHQHLHSVLIYRGRGQVLIRDSIHDVSEKDVVFVPSMTWHQFRANRGGSFGFLCLVNCERDKPIRPLEEDLATLRQNPDVAEFIRV